MAISRRTLLTTAGSAAALAGLPRASAAAAPALGVEGSSTVGSCTTAFKQGPPAS
ncbi:hypothetical protein GCM10009811_18080 [Nostocoides veronense]|uniref:Uncharacterized protein n=1 Tax=Nostocoides veronense TaxID=330836 RepID=A0ABN2LMF0_9MICO